MFEQGIVQGGVTGAGFSTGMGFGSGTTEIYIEPNSVVLKAYMFFYSQRNPPSTTYVLNNNNISTDECTLISEVNYGNPPWTFATPNRLFYKEITDIIDVNTQFINVSIPPQLNLEINEGFWAVYIIVIYENINLGLTNYSIILNNQDLTGYEEYDVIGLNPMESNYPVGFALFADRVSSFQSASSNVSIQGLNIGNIYGADNINSSFIASGVKGHFFYQNATLYGLDDDIPNSSMNQSDGLADISNYIISASTSLSFSLAHVNYPNQPPNQNKVNLAYFLTYTSPCQPFSHSLLTSDTTTCANTPLQLGSSGGIAYNWLPQTNLSCYDCPNPVFTGDSTINYTVRIWSTDSCSVVQPVRVRVLSLPNFDSVNLTENICGFEVGIIAGTSTSLSLPHSYQINNSTPQNNFNFSNLEAGIYTITVTDANGCSRDSTVQILEVNNVQAAFSVNPNSGAAPLTVQTQNTSQNATEYQWFWGDEISTLQNPSITLDTAGIYTLTLVASNGAAHCNDTATALIFVEEPFVVFAYSYVTDEADVYQIFLSGVSEYHYDLYALDGKLVYRQNGNIEAAGYADLWEISWVSSGMYVFRVKVKENAGNEQEVEGKGAVVR